MRSRAVVVTLEELLDAPDNEWSRHLSLVPAAAPISKPTPRAVLKRIWSITSIVLAIGACVFWAMFLRPQSLGGPAAYVLVSGKSMNPLYHTGDLILVRRRASYHVGDIVAYRVPKGDAMAGAQVIHRIVGGNGSKGFVVQGDNRTAPDVWRPKVSDIVGSATLQIPQAVVVLQFLRSPLLLGLLAASFVFVFLLTGGKKEKEKEKEKEQEQDPEPAPPLS